MLEYKALKAGKLTWKIGRFEPSSQICSCCGHQQKMPLETRIYECPECGMKLDRDVNAAVNIRNFSLRNILKNTAGTAGINACGDGSSGGCDANCSHETTVEETRKSACNKSRRSHSLECD